MFDWLSAHQALLQKLAGASVLLSVVSFLVTLAVLPIAVLSLPEDYFAADRRDPVRKHRVHPAIAAIGVVAKNLLGIALIAAGAVMLLIPGQGILTMLIGLILTNFPGKFRLEQNLVRRPAVLRTLNRLRARAGKPPLIGPGGPTSD